MATWGPTAIAATGDDGYDEAGAWTTSQLFVGNDGAITNMGMRWVNVTVPQGATIDSATIHLTARGLTGAATDVEGLFVGHDDDNAAQWAEGGLEPNNITQTTATAAFSPTAWVTTTQYPFTVTSVVQEIISRAGWASGNAIAIALLNNGSASGASCRAYDFIDAEFLATLTIDYTEAVVSGPSFSLRINLRPMAFAPGLAR